MPDDRERLLIALRHSSTAIEHALAGVPTHRMRIKPSPDEWSPLEIIEHIGLVDKAFSGRIAGAESLNERVYDPAREARLTAGVKARTQPIPSPEFCLPKGIYQSAQEATEGLAGIRSGIAATIESGTCDLLAQRVDHPRLGPMSAYEAYLVIAAHGERHAAQITEVAGT